MKSCIYTNSNLSGIGDRLFDIIQVYSFAKYIGCEKLYLEWRFDENDMASDRDIYTITRMTKTPFRKYDYLFENLIQFIKLPDDILFVSKNVLNNLVEQENNIIFSQYLGMTYSLSTFIDTYLAHLNSYEKNNFIEQYYNNFKKIEFKNIPENVVNCFKKNDIVTIHLRRGDKVIDDNGDCCGIRVAELENLNRITEEIVDKFINLGYKNICFVSDEKDVKSCFINKFNDKCNIINFISENEIYQTYYDLYFLSHSKHIVMSQSFSVFSMLASLIGGTNFYYIYVNSKLEQGLFSKNKNFYHYSLIEATHNLHT